MNVIIIDIIICYKLGYNRPLSGAIPIVFV
jgi:hypothetical protein